MKANYSFFFLPKAAPPFVLYLLFLFFLSCASLYIITITKSCFTVLRKGMRENTMTEKL